MHVAKRTRHACLACALILCTRAAFGQSIAGVVRDPQQAVVVAAPVVLVSARTERATTVTDAQGRYRFDAITPGTYVVEVRASGFRVAASPEITLSAGQSVTRDFLLALAGTTESVTVSAAGSAEQSYRVGAVSSLGSLGPVSLLDTPYTVTVLPGELLANGQVKNFKEASKYLPLVQFQEMQGSEILRPATRGMQGSNMQNARLDGMGIVVTGANSIESLQQIEVLNGIGGALYGPANPSGMFNFVPKRPTDRPIRRVDVSVDARSVGTVHADVGGRVGPDARFGYRANLLAGEGGQFVPGSHLERRLVSVAGDVRPFTRTVIDAFYSNYHLEQRGFPGWFTYGRSSARNTFIELPPDAPDPAREGYGQHSAGVDLQSRIGQVRLKHDFSNAWRLSVGALDQLVERDISTPVNALTDSTGNYTASLASGFAPRFRVFSQLSHLNGRFETGSVQHEIAIGVTGYTFKTYSDVTNPSPAAVLLGTASIARPVVFPLPAAGLPSHTNIYLSSGIHQQGINVADLVTIGNGWSMRVAASQDWIWTDNFNNRNVRTGGYKADAVSPLVSVMYKPAPQMTVYATWGSSLQQGDVAPGTAVNAGQGLAPYRSEQQEIGYKLTHPRFDLSTAVFRLDRPFANLEPDNVFRISGHQLNYGAEAMVTARIGTRLVTYGGVTVLDPRLTKTVTPGTDDKHFVGIPSYKSNVLGEYRLPAGRATFLSINWQLVGRRPIDDINSTWTDGYNVVDLGARYAHLLMNKIATWRINVNNVGDTHYWSTLGPGNITGTNLGSYTAHLGLPRTVSASMEVAF